jgi:hypothetical protein
LVYAEIQIHPAARANLMVTVLVGMAVVLVVLLVIALELAAFQKCAIPSTTIVMGLLMVPLAVLLLDIVMIENYQLNPTLCFYHHV